MEHPKTNDHEGEPADNNRASNQQRVVYDAGTLTDNQTTAKPQDNETKHSPTFGSQLRTAILSWLHHYWDAPREKSKWTDVSLVVLTLLIAAAAFWSAHIFQYQVSESSESFRTDERAWVEIEPIKPVLIAQENATFGATFTCDIYPKNVGKTVARDIMVNANDLLSAKGFDNDAATVRSTQDNLLLGKNREMESGKQLILPNNPVPKVLAPNTVSAAPFRLTCEAPKNHGVHYLIGRIDYCDEFKVKHWLKFCFHIVNARGEIWPCQEGNDEDRNKETPTAETACAKQN